MVLGYPFLREFNPNLDWKLGKILGSRLKIYTINRAIGLDMFRCQIDRAVSQLEEGEELHYRINRMTMATKMAIKDYDPTKVNTAETIPERYKRFTKVFSDEEAQCFPPKRPWDHHIWLKPGAPDIINGKIYPLNIGKQKAEDKYLDENIEKGYISEGSGPYGCSVFYGKKKNGEYCPIVNYCPLNKHTIPDVMPLPMIPVIHNKMRGKKLFSKFDICWGYNNIQIAEEDRWKTGFKTSRGVFELNVMNFGLCNAPASFSCMGIHLFRPIADK